MYRGKHGRNGLSEVEWILDTSIYMALSSEMDDTINMLILHQLQETIEVANIHLNELVVWLIFNIFEVCQITCVCQLIKTDDIVFWVLIYKKAYYV